MSTNEETESVVVLELPEGYVDHVIEMSKDAQKYIDNFMKQLHGMKLSSKKRPLDPQSLLAKVYLIKLAQFIENHIEQEVSCELSQYEKTYEDVIIN